MIETSEILQVASKQLQHTIHTPQVGEISPKPQGQEGHIRVSPESGEIPPIQADKNSLPHTTPNLNKIPPKEPQKVTDLVAMEEGEIVEMPNKNTQHMHMREHKPQSDENL